MLNQAANPLYIVIMSTLGVWTILYLGAGLAPYRFDFHAIAKPRLLFVTPLNAVLNYLCFVPFGVLIATLPIERPLLAAGLYCGALSFLVEFLQLFLRGRFTTITDWLLNTGGGLTGALLVPMANG